MRQQWWAGPLRADPLELEADAVGRIADRDVAKYDRHRRATFRLERCRHTEIEESLAVLHGEVVPDRHRHLVRRLRLMAPGLQRRSIKDQFLHE